MKRPGTGSAIGCHAYSPQHIRKFTGYGKGMVIDMKKIGIISDTHGLLRPEVERELRDCEVILHGGDFDNIEIFKALKDIAPIYGVQGNNDDWANIDLPETLSVELYGLKFFMTHNKKMIPRDITGFDIVIYGHSHKYEETYLGNRLLLNPGSCGPKRFSLPITMAILEVWEDGSFHVRKINLGKAENFRLSPKQSPNMKKIIELVMRDTDRGVLVGKMAKKYAISQELAEQICRLYLTHPGIDADGIMRKMGL